MPAAEMINGTIMGEIRIAMIKDLNGISARLKPKAAMVPSVVEIIVAKTAIIKLFLTAPCQFRLEKKSWYHLVEYPAGSNDSISGVKLKNGTALKDKGMITKMGAIK